MCATQRKHGTAQLKNRAQGKVSPEYPGCYWTTPSLPGQPWSLQVYVSSVVPAQCLPPFCGSGLVHVLLRVLVPPPHVAVHTDQSLQSDQPPSGQKRTCNVKIKQSAARVCKSLQHVLRDSNENASEQFKLPEFKGEITAKFSYLLVHSFHPLDIQSQNLTEREKRQ